MPSSEQDPSNMKSVTPVQMLMSKRDFCLAMRRRGIISLSPAGLSGLEREGHIRLDYAFVSSRYFIMDTPENEAAMRAYHQSRAVRQDRIPGWVRELHPRLSASDLGAAGAPGALGAAATAGINGEAAAPG